jgi:hypothetical protein
MQTATVKRMRKESEPASSCFEVCWLVSVGIWRSRLGANEEGWEGQGITTNGSRIDGRMVYFNLEKQIIRLKSPYKMHISLIKLGETCARLRAEDIAMPSSQANDQGYEVQIQGRKGGIPVPFGHRAIVQLTGSRPIWSASPSFAGRLLLPLDNPASDYQNEFRATPPRRRSMLRAARMPENSPIRRTNGR